jgi:hypothetical protein
LPAIRYFSSLPLGKSDLAWSHLDQHGSFSHFSPKNSGNRVRIGLLPKAMKSGRDLFRRKRRAVLTDQLDRQGCDTSQPGWPLSRRAAAFPQSLRSAVRLWWGCQSIDPGQISVDLLAPFEQLDGLAQRICFRFELLQLAPEALHDCIEIILIGHPPTSLAVRLHLLPDHIIGLA